MYDINTDSVDEDFAEYWIHRNTEEQKLAKINAFMAEWRLGGYKP